MPDWLLWMAAAWLLFGCGAGCRRVSGRHARSGGEGERGRAGRSGSAVGAGAESLGGTSAPLDPGAAGRDRDVVATLQRRYVEGLLSLEQYEAELDRLDRRRLL